MLASPGDNRCGFICTLCFPWVAFRDPLEYRNLFREVVTGAWKRQGSACSGTLLLVWSFSLWSSQNELHSLEFRTGTERGSSLECHCMGNMLTEFTELTE